MADQRVIGNKGRLPWSKIPGDLRHFKATTLEGTVIMGRKTFESIGKLLPNRENIVLSRSTFEVPPQVKLAHSFEEALEAATKEKVFVIGGAELFQETMEIIDGIFMTRIHATYPGDTHYPSIPDYFKLESSTPQQQSGEPRLELMYFKNTRKG